METTINSITVSGGANAINNIIPRSSLKDVQADVLRDLKNAIVNSMDLIHLFLEEIRMRAL